MCSAMMRSSIPPRPTSDGSKYTSPVRTRKRWLKISLTRGTKRALSSIHSSANSP
jgi:hypothetical protein